MNELHTLPIIISVSALCVNVFTIIAGVVKLQHYLNSKFSEISERLIVVETTLEIRKKVKS